MAAETDRLLLSNRKLFQIVRSAENNSSSKTKNIIECKDDILYVWNRADKCVLTLNIKTSSATPADESTYQTLLPTDPPQFEVECLLVSETASYLAVIGNRGIATIELPRRRGLQATFLGGKPIISCRCHPVDQHLFACSPQVEVRQARWHPGSPADCHLLVLTSENSFRLYKVCAGGEPRLCEVWPLGRTPGPTLGVSTRLSLLAGLGDTCVAFDFLHPLTSSAETPGHMVERLGGSIDMTDPSTSSWVILVLRGNGDVYSVTAPISSDGSSKPLIQGPLAMHPSADDNYGADACSILCLNSEPPVVVIATCSGTLYHCLLMDKEEYGIQHTNIYSSKSLSRYGSTYSIHSPEMMLYVFESIELELGLFSEDNEETYSCPIHLRHNIFDRSRYFCAHDTGIHMMSLPIVSQLKVFLHASDDNDQTVPSLQASSSAEYLVCTRSAASPVMPVLGLTFSCAPTMLITLLASGEVLSLPLASTHTLPAFTSMLSGEELGGQVTEALREPFDEHIRTLLKHNLTQPILKFGPNADLSPKECMELISRTSQLLQGEYFSCHDKVRMEMEQRVETLQMLKDHQLCELEQMKKEKAKLQQAAEELAERYEDIKDKQEELTMRAENILRLLSTRQPVISLAEKKFAEELKKIEAKVEVYKKSLEQVKAKQVYHKTQSQQWTQIKEQQEVYLSPSQLKTVKSILTQVTDGISDLRRKTNTTKRELGL